MKGITNEVPQSLYSAFNFPAEKVYLSLTLTLEPKYTYTYTRVFSELMKMCTVPRENEQNTLKCFNDYRRGLDW
jgi:hypothetical protein